MNNYTALADAILRGAALRPQTTDGTCFGKTSGDQPPFASCSWGAAYESVNGPVLTWADVPDWYEVAESLYNAFPCVADAAPPCPASTCIQQSFHMSWDSGDCLQDLINHLNDEHKWSRESIAAFVRGLRDGDEH